MEFQEFLEEWNNENDYINVHTSGSTSIPKIISLPKYFVIESAQRTNAFFKIQKGNRLHSCIGADFIGGKMMAVRAEIAKAFFTYETPSNQPLKNFDSIEELDLVAVVPSQMPFILDHLDTLPKIKNLLIGGSAIHPTLKKKIAQSVLNAYESYGMTETASHIALRKITIKETPFQLLPGICIASDKDNCLIIKFIDGTIIHTNDIVELISDSEFYVKGRRDDVIISGGKKINPYEVESKISTFIKSPYIVTGFPDEKWGEKVVLLIEGGSEDINLKENLNIVLEKWEIPKAICYIKSLPRTSNGKLIRIKDPSSLSFAVPGNNLSSSGQNKPEL